MCIFVYLLQFKWNTTECVSCADDKRKGPMELEMNVDIISLSLSLSASQS